MKAKNNRQKAAKRAAIAAAFAAGEVMQTIADREGVTKQRVQQILVALMPPEAARRVIAEWDAAAIRAAVLTLSPAVIRRVAIAALTHAPAAT